MGFIRSSNAPKKELEDFNFILHKVYDIESIAEGVTNFSDEWLIDQSRQTATYANRRNPHINTKTFVVQDHSIEWDFGTKIDPVIKDMDVFNLVVDIVKDLELKFNGVAGRVLLINLSANSDVSEHTDKGDYLSTVKRFHIPIITNESVYYTVNGEQINMKVGECWEINNLKPHSVLNDSDMDRVHLLVDIFSNYSYKDIKDFSTKYEVDIIEDFISEEDADIFIEYIKSNHLDEEKFPPTRAAIELNRHRYEANIPETVPLKNHHEIEDKIKVYSEKVIDKFKSFYKDDELYVSAFWMAELGENTKLPYHSDNHYKAEHLYRSCVIYLNDDYEGGMIRFRDIPLTYKPKKLSAVFFKSDMVHEIVKIESGIRFALPIWASQDPKWDIFSDKPMPSDKEFMINLKKGIVK